MKFDNNTAKKIKEDFPIFKHNMGLVYLDNAATSQKPKQVLNTIINFYERDNANVGRGVYFLAARALEKYENSRKVVANFIGSDSGEIVFTKNTTESINLLVFSLYTIFQKGRDEILLTEMEHHSNIVPWQQLAMHLKMKVKFVKLTKDFRLDMNDLNEKLTEKTAVFAFTYASNVLGTINDVKLLSKLAKEKGAFSVIDAAQAIQHFPINVKDIGCDFLAFSSHKMLGPNGTGILFGRKDLLEKMSIFNTGGGMIETVSQESSTWKKGNEKYEAGTQNIAGAISLAAAIDYINNIGLENIKQWENYLFKYSLKRLSEIPGIKIYNPGDSSVSLVSFSLPGIHPHDVAELLNEKKIAIRAGHMCAMPLMSVLGAKGGVCRASFSFYNTLEDVDALVDSLKEIQKRFA